ncbi:MAG: baseplate J/gp47 family protein [Ruminococcus sp.]|nr:baseplate J/gp47 family protein [Ruminococcus sp.]
MSSYEEILSRMVKKYEELSGNTVNEQSDIMLRLSVLSGELYNSYVAGEFIKRQMFVSTATGEYLDKHALSRGLSRKEAGKASGEVTFSVETVSDKDIVIDKGTVVSTSGESAVQYITDSAVTLYAGDQSVTADVTAVEGGAKYNVVADKVCVLVTPPSGITAVTNAKSIKGGTDAETDEELRERVLSSYRDISNGTNAVYYQRLAQSVSGVHSASVVSKARGEGTINVYVCGKKNSPMNSEVIAQVQELLDENRELNVDVLVLYAEPVSVSCAIKLEVEDGYSFESVKLEIEEKAQRFVESLGVGKPMLLCELGDLIFHTYGVKNYEFVRAYSEDVYPAANKYCVLSEFFISEVS